MSFSDFSRRPVRRLTTLGATAILVLAQANAGAQQVRSPMLHAHNCYPYHGEWADRLDRALAPGRRPIAIEQDVVWAPDRDGGQSVVSHEPKLAGDEPTLDTHFFARVTPLLERALAENRRDTWPIVVLHLDFKTNEPAHHRAIWTLLGKYERFVTTAPRVADAATPQPFTYGPLLVLTEQGTGQQAVFHDAVPIGGKLRIFGTVPSAPMPSSGNRADTARAMATVSPETLIPSGATNYRRWTNFSWAVVEAGGQAGAGSWDAIDDARLKAIVERAHDLGLWVRFYTLNGHAHGQGLGWGDGYNFGSIDAVKPRWRAALAAGVDFIATDQYEEFSREMK